MSEQKKAVACTHTHMYTHMYTQNEHKHNCSMHTSIHIFGVVAAARQEAELQEQRRLLVSAAAATAAATTTTTAAATATGSACINTLSISVLSNSHVRYAQPLSSNMPLTQTRVD